MSASRDPRPAPGRICAALALLAACGGAGLEQALPPASPLLPPLELEVPLWGKVRGTPFDRAKGEDRSTDKHTWIE